MKRWPSALTHSTMHGSVRNTDIKAATPRREKIRFAISLFTVCIKNRFFKDTDHKVYFALPATSIMNFKTELFPVSDIPGNNPDP